jgi:large subunit ribosomal protein L15
MFSLHNLEKLTTQRKQRVGRGNGSNRGKNAGKGHKGQNKHGQGVRIGFEGGQKTLLQRTPKFRGFRSYDRQNSIVFSADTLDKNFPNSTITFDMLIEKGLISDKIKFVRIVRGKKMKLSFKVQNIESIYLTKGVKSILDL